MGLVYVTGHKNPDTDSIVAAMTFAALKNALGERDVVPVRLGDVNHETKIILERFGFEPPMPINNVRTQLKDVAFDTPPIVGSSVTVRTAWNVMNEHGVYNICIADEDGYLVGTLSTGDIAAYDMNSALTGYMISTTIYNLASALEGYIVTPVDGMGDISGLIQICVHDSEHIVSEEYHKGIMISGKRNNIIEIAEKAGVECLILCQVDADSDLAQQAKDAKVNVILTHYGPYRASRLISHSVSVSSILNGDSIHKDKSIVFHESDFISDVKEVMQNNRASSYPVLNANEKVVGTVSRYHLLNHNRKKLILVDHNEPSQSVTGIEEAELLEIIDHHRLGSIETSGPVKIRMEAVGSTNTIIASLFFEHGVTPKRGMAGLIVAAILSDTVMFKSPTCTEKDKRMAYRMAQIAGIDLNELAIDIFSSTSSSYDNNPRELLNSDLKEFTFGDFKVGIGQITCMSIKDIEKHDNELIEVMSEMQKEKSYDYLFFMETEILEKSTKLLFVGDAKELIEGAFGIVPNKPNMVYLPNIMSRKKQVVPFISAVLST